MWTVRTINVLVPFKGCAKCKRFRLEINSIDGENFNGEATHFEEYKCQYEFICGNVPEVLKEDDEEPS